MKLSEIISVLLPGRTGQTEPGEPECEPAGYSIDSRTVAPGELFIAIRGAVNDGHRYVGDALAKGAVAAVVESTFTPHRVGADGISQACSLERKLIRVPDTLRALQSLGEYVIANWRGCEVAVTGSSGKTTTKEIAARLLEDDGTTTRSSGNFNNEYGLPLSILQMESGGRRASGFKYAVFEMGMNHAGEIRRLTRIAPPSIGVVTNVSAAHLEFFSSVDEIAAAKSEMIAGVREHGAGVLNADDPRVAVMRSIRSDLDYVTFGLEKPADVSAAHVVLKGGAGTEFTLCTPDGSCPASLSLMGRHNLYNALAASAVAAACGILPEAIAGRLRLVSAGKMRGELIEFAAGFAIVDDSYNSNPAALAAQVSALESAAGRRIVVAGEMLELGEASERLHAEAGRMIFKHGIHLLIGVRGNAQAMTEGAVSAGMPRDRAVFVESPEAAASFLAEQVRPGDAILVKGSRGVHLETVVEAMKLKFEPDGANR